MKWKKVLAGGVVSSLVFFGGATMTQAATTLAQAKITQGATAVTFQHGAWKMAGNLYLPKGYQQGKKYPAIVLLTELRIFVVPSTI